MDLATLLHEQTDKAEVDNVLTKDQSHGGDSIGEDKSTATQVEVLGK